MNYIHVVRRPNGTKGGFDRKYICRIVKNVQWTYNLKKFYGIEFRGLGEK